VPAASNDEKPDGRRRDAPPALGRQAERRRVVLVPGGPTLIEGPVEIELADGSTVVCDRFMVAICMCRRSRRFPLCDTSHRRRPRANADRE
jgi:hypothetical protein